MRKAFSLLQPVRGIQPLPQYPGTSDGLAHWVLDQFGTQPTPESLTLARYFVGYWEHLGSGQVPIWTQDGRLGMRLGWRSDRYFELGTVDPKFWFDMLPGVPEADEIGSPFCLFASSKHRRYGGPFRFGTLRDLGDGRRRLLICAYSRRYGWQHFRRRPENATYGSFILAVARGVANPRRAVTTIEVGSRPRPELAGRRPVPAEVYDRVNPDWINSRLRLDPELADTNLI